MKCRVSCVVGARPNFMKSAPLMREFQKNDRFEAQLIHTGQHYDEKLSQLFFDDLKMHAPNVYLGVGSGSHAQQTAKIMMENGIYLVGTTFSVRALHIVEFGILLDVLAGVMIMAVILQNIKQTFDDVDTALLRTLKE